MEDAPGYYPDWLAKGFYFGHESPKARKMFYLVTHLETFSLFRAFVVKHGEERFQLLLPAFSYRPSAPTQLVKRLFFHHP